MVNKQLLIKTLRHLHEKKRKEWRADRAVLGLGILGALILGAFLVSLIGSLYLSRTVASLLPAGKTVLYLEMEDLDLPYKLADSPLRELFSPSLLLKTLGIDESVLPSWAKKNVGVALVENKPVLFFRSASRRSALNFLQSMELKGEKLENRGTPAFPIYIYPQGQSFAFAFAGPYLFMSPDAHELESINRVLQGQEPALEADPGWKTAMENLPRTAWGKGYLNIQSLGIPALDAVLNPLRQFSSQLGFTIRRESKGFHFNSFLALNRDVVNLNAAPATQNLLTFGLSEFMPAENLGLYLGGADLSAEWKNTLAKTAKLNPAYGILLEGLIRAQVNRIFGNQVNLENDIYPLFKGEYALGFGPKKDGAMAVELLLTQTDPAGVKTKLAKLADGFSLLAAQFTPQVVTVTLPDGTVSRELVTDPGSLERHKETAEGYDVDCIETKASVYGFCYAVTDKLAILTNSLDALKTTLKTLHSPDAALSAFQPFRESLSALSQVNEEMSFANFQKLIPLIQGTAWGTILAPYLAPLDSATWVKHSFADGVSTEGFVLIK